MYKQSNGYYTRMSHPVRDVGAKPASQLEHQARVLNDLRRLGVSRWGMASMEAKYLPRIIHNDENIGGVVYGLHDDGFVMLVATDHRVIFLDRKPLFVNEDEINYFVVSGVSYSHVGLGVTVSLHTRIRDYTIRTFNQKCADRFVGFIEARTLKQKGTSYDQPT